MSQSYRRVQAHSHCRNSNVIPSQLFLKKYICKSLKGQGLPKLCEAFFKGIQLNALSIRFTVNVSRVNSFTIVPTKSDSGAIFCLQLLSKTLTCTLP